jgi:hypothetical protein
VWFQLCGFLNLRPLETMLWRLSWLITFRSPVMICAKGLHFTEEWEQSHFIGFVSIPQR